MDLGCASDELKRASVGQQNTQDEVQIVCNGFENTSLVLDRQQICFVDGFELQNVAAAIQRVSVFRSQKAAAAIQIVIRSV